MSAFLKLNKSDHLERDSSLRSKESECRRSSERCSPCSSLLLSLFPSLSLPLLWRGVCVRTGEGSGHAGRVEWSWRCSVGEEGGWMSSRAPAFHSVAQTDSDSSLTLLSPSCQLFKQSIGSTCKTQPVFGGSESSSGFSLCSD